MAAVVLVSALGACGESHAGGEIDGGADRARDGGVDAGSGGEGGGEVDASEPGRDGGWAPRDAGDPGAGDGGPPDGGSELPPDAGAQPTCDLWSADVVPKLREPCLPRCTEATMWCFYACRDDRACASACTAGDTEPALMLSLNGMSLGELSCDRCVSWQTDSCYSDSCPQEMEACAACGSCGPEPGCEVQEASLASCRAANRDAIDSCVEGRRRSCFP